MSKRYGRRFWLMLMLSLVLSLIAFLPMRLALGWFDLGRAGISARAVEGVIWNGRLRAVHVGRLNLGDIDAALSPWRLFVGEARLNFSSVVAAPDVLKGVITLASDSVSVSTVSGAVPTTSAFAPIPIDTIMFEDFAARFESGRCAEASGRVRAQITGDLIGLNLAQGLSGTARCDRNALLLPLQGQSGLEGLAVRLFADGRYELILAVRGIDPAIGARLQAAGFQPSGEGWRLKLSGRF